jgi:hypothetical protein
MDKELLEENDYLAITQNQGHTYHAVNMQDGRTR